MAKWGPSLGLGVVEFGEQPGRVLRTTCVTVEVEEAVLPSEAVDDDSPGVPVLLDCRQELLERFDHPAREVSCAIGVVSLVAFTVAFYPSVRGQASFEEVYEDLPDTFRAMIGSTAGISITSPRGYLQARLFGSLFPVVLLVLAIGTAVRATAGAEEDGTLDS